MNSAVQATRMVLSKYATFSGRATRSEFWWWVLSVFVVLAISRLIDGALIAPMLGFESFQEEAGQPLSVIISLLILLPNLAVGARRLHDIGKSGWWLLMGLIPVVGFVVLLYFDVQPSEENANEFGLPEPFGSS